MSLDSLRDLWLGVEVCEDALETAYGHLKDLKEALNRMLEPHDDKPSEVKRRDFGEPINEISFRHIENQIVYNLSHSVQPWLTFSGLKQVISYAPHSKGTCFTEALAELVKRKVVTKHQPGSKVSRICLTDRVMEVQRSVSAKLIIEVLGKRELFPSVSSFDKGGWMKRTRLATWCGLSRSGCNNFALLVKELVDGEVIEQRSTNRHLSYRLPKEA